MDWEWTYTDKNWNKIKWTWIEGSILNGEELIKKTPDTYIVGRRRKNWKIVIKR
jgi:hypothetical protein